MLGQSGGNEKARVENNAMSLQMAGVVFFWESYLFLSGSINLFSLFFYSLQLHPNYFSLLKIHRYNLDEKRSIQTINIIRPEKTFIHI